MKSLKTLFFLFTITILACNSQKKDQIAMEEDAWDILFDGQSMNQWRNFGQQEIRGWTIINNELTCLGIDDTHGDLITNEQYENFILKLDWKISEKGNSGILYLVVEDTFKTSYHTGPEYQIIDDKGYPELHDWQKSGSNYAMDSVKVPPTNPVGKWNKAIIQVKDGVVSHWLNGRQVVTYELWTSAWYERKNQNKWKDFPLYGTFKKGHIALQDHGDIVAFRNIRIKKL